MSADLGRWFRAIPDSSALPRPRLLARSLIAVADLDDRIDFYQRLLGVPADLRMPIPDFGGLELAAVGGLLLIASERPFTTIQRRTAYSLIVPSLDRALAGLDALGASVLEPPERIVPGSRARVRYPDGSVAELVEHRPRPGERPRPAPSASCPAAGRAPGTTRLLARRLVRRDGFAGALDFYTRALDTPADLIRPASPAGAGLAVIGNLLLVASDAPDDGDAGPAIALLALDPASVPDEIGSRAVTLPDGGPAEAWGTREQLAALPETVG